MQAGDAGIVFVPKTEIRNRKAELVEIIKKTIFLPVTTKIPGHLHLRGCGPGGRAV